MVAIAHPIELAGVDGVTQAVFKQAVLVTMGRVFRMAMKFGTPIVPVSMVGAFEFNKKTSWLLRPGTITVYLHDVIETKDLRKEDFPALRDRVHAIISSPMEEALVSTHEKKVIL